MLLMILNDTIFWNYYYYLDKSVFEVFDCLFQSLIIETYRCVLHVK